MIWMMIGCTTLSQDSNGSGNSECVVLTCGGAYTGDAEIEVTPSEIDFGIVSIGQTVERIETVANVADKGATALEIYSLALEDTSGPFSVSAIGSVLIPPGASATFTVTFKPNAVGESSNFALVQSNDPDGEFSSVALAGTGQ